MPIKLTELDKQTLKTAIESGGWITGTRYPDRYFYGKRYVVKGSAKIRPQTFRRLYDAGLLRPNGDEGGHYYFYQVTDKETSRTMNEKKVTQFLKAAYEEFVNRKYDNPKWADAEFDTMTYDLEKNSFEFVVDGKTYAVTVEQRGL